jgi:PAS domain S-box-containing protein
MEGRYRGLLEAAPDAMVVVNQGGEIVLLNVQAEKQFGYRRDELLGQKVTNIIPDGFAERLVSDGLRSAEDALAQQIGTGIELTARRKDGSEFPDRAHAEPAGERRRHPGHGGHPQHQRAQGGGNASGADGGPLPRTARGSARCHGGGESAGRSCCSMCRPRSSSATGAMSCWDRRSRTSFRTASRSAWSPTACAPLKMRWHNRSAPASSSRRGARTVANFRSSSC